MVCLPEYKRKTWNTIYDQVLLMKWLYRYNHAAPSIDKSLWDYHRFQNGRHTSNRHQGNWLRPASTIQVLSNFVSVSFYLLWFNKAQHSLARWAGEVCVALPFRVFLVYEGTQRKQKHNQSHFSKKKELMISNCFATVKCHIDCNFVWEVFNRSHYSVLFKRKTCPIWILKGEYKIVLNKEFFYFRRQKQ